MSLRNAIRSIIMLFPPARRRYEYIVNLNRERDLLIFRQSQSEEQIEQLTNQVMSDRGTVHVLEEKVEYLFPFKAASGELELRIAALQASTSVIEERNNALDYECEAQQIEIRDLEAQVEQLRANGERRGREQSERIAELETGIARLETEIARAKARQMSDATDKAELRQMVGELEMNLENAAAAHAALRTQHGTLAADLEAATDRNHLLERRMHNITSAVAANEAERQTLEDRLAKALAAQAASRLELRLALIELDAAHSELGLDTPRSRLGGDFSPPIRRESPVEAAQNSGAGSESEKQDLEALQRALTNSRTAAHSAGSLLKAEIKRAREAEAEIARLRQRVETTQATALASDNMVQIEHARAEAAVRELETLKNASGATDPSAQKGKSARRARETG